MKQFTAKQKLDLLEKANEQGYEIGITGWFQETGTLNLEALENGLNPNNLSKPINWDVDEIVDYNKQTVVYDVSDGTASKENLSEDQLFAYLDQALN